MTDVGELVLRIKADAAQLEREMKKAQGVVQQGAGGMTTAFGRLKSEILSLAPAITAVGFVTFAKQAVDAAGHIVDLADRIGFASSTIAAMEIPLAASGSSLDEFSASINRMNNAVGEARNGNEATIKAFDALGLSVDALAKLSPEEQFYEIASALGQIKDQSLQTEAGMNIFGRSFAAMLPLLKEYGGDMRKAVEAQKEMNESLDPATLKRIDEFGDSLSAAAIKIRNSFLEAFGVILKVNDLINEVLEKPSVNAKWNMPGDNSAFKVGPNLPKGTVSDTRPVSVDYAVFGGTEQYGPPMRSNSAKGSNADLLGRIQAAKDATKATKQEADAVELCTTAYDKLGDKLKDVDYIQGLLHDRLAKGLTDVAFRARTAEDAMLGFAQAIAEAYFQKKVAGPLADTLIGNGESKGLLDQLLSGAGRMLGFADGGSPPVGVPSIVGERGPEIFVPNTSGTIVPNNKIGGQTINVYQTIQVNPGVPELINVKIREAAPAIAAMAQQGIRAGAEKGGTDSQLFRLRS